MERTISLRQAQGVALLALGLHLLFGLLTFLLASQNHSLATTTNAWQYLVGSPLWLLVYLHLRQRRLAWEEEMEENKLAREIKGSDSLFAGKEVVDLLSARHRLKSLETWFVPLATLFLGILYLALAGWLLYQWHSEGEPAQVSQASITTAFLAGFAFFSLLIAKYALGMSQQVAWRLLRAGGSYLLVSAFFAFATAIAVAVSVLEIRQPEYYLAALMPVVLGLLGCEWLLNLVLDLYRPRLAEQEVRQPYDSRLLSLFTGSRNLLRSIAHTLDYQFGFKVSDTWFYQFLQKAIVPLILFQVLALYFLNCLVIVKPDEQAILERFGRPAEGQVLLPGLNWKWPWPIEVARHYPANRALHLRLGIEEESKHSAENGHRGEHDRPASRQGTISSRLHTQEHGHEGFPFLVARKLAVEPTQPQEQAFVPVSLLDLELEIHYRITDLYAYAYHAADPEQLLSAIAYEELTKAMASADLWELMGPKRIAFASLLRESLGERCQAVNLGLEMTLVGLCAIHPPAQVAEAFETAADAEEEKHTKILAALTYSDSLLPLAEAEKKALQSEAETYLLERSTLTKAEAEQFAGQRQAYQAGGSLYLLRNYLRSLEKWVVGRRLYVIHTPGTPKQVDVLNLEDLLTPDITQLDLTKENDHESPK